MSTTLITSTSTSTSTTWNDIRNEWSKAQQMGHQAVMQAAKVGRMLSELRGDMPMRDFVSRVKQELPDSDLNLAKISRLETLAHNIPLIEEHRPDSQRQALALIRKSNRPPTPPRSPHAVAEIKREAAESRARYGSKGAEEVQITCEASPGTDAYVPDEGAEYWSNNLGDTAPVAAGIFTEVEYELIHDCLDPDRETASERRAEALQLFTGRRELLVRPSANSESVSAELSGAESTHETAARRAA